MIYNIEHIKEVIKGSILNDKLYEATISNVVYDTRKVSFHDESVFFALEGNKADGHDYLSTAYKKGIRNFVVSKKINLRYFPASNFILCDDTLLALQEWASYHRAAMSCAVIGVTGSNGKTIVKEWLAEALDAKYKVDKSPLSFNSQLGVALSVLQLEETTELAIIEAGISTSGEMEKLEKIIKPHIGILTNIGDAHSQGFSSDEVKLAEKLCLYNESQLIIYNKDMPLVDRMMCERYPLNTISWGEHSASDILLTSLHYNTTKTEVKLSYGTDEFRISIPFTNKDFCENALHVISYLILDNWNEKEIQTAVDRFTTLPNRLEIKQGTNNCILINDSYSLDLASLQLALEKMEALAGKTKKVVFLSAFDQQNDKAESYKLLSELLEQKDIDELVTIGMPADKWTSKINTHAYNTTESCLAEYNFEKLKAATVLIKGARKYSLETIFNELAEQVHQTKLETNLTAITQNLNFYRSLLRPETKIMAVVKAEAYGSGSTQMVRFLEEQKVNYLAVALIDEAIKLRKKGCTLPIMVFNIQEENLNQLWSYDLEPEVYDFSILKKLRAAALIAAKPLNIHLKVDTGMNRLGFLPDQLEELINELRQVKLLRVHSIFSHLAASENSDKDSFTKKQLSVFDHSYDFIAKNLDLTTRPIKHIINTTGIVRFPDHQHDMVRLGLGLYGIDEAKLVEEQLTKAHTLTAKVLQIKPLAQGDATGYNRSGLTDIDTHIAIISIGYADGLLRSGGNGKLHFQIGKKQYPTIGNICMDVSMLNLGSDSNVKVGDEVIIFGPDLSIENIATSCNTITYEIISRLAPRIKRSYIYE